MNLDPNTCYRAVRSRDRRFDGKFFVGITSTGVYCRPICPAPHALKSNMQFYACAAAAEDAGFRPCLRCFPERSPHFAARPNGNEITARALRLISDNLLHEECVDSVADRLGISSRHLRRVFKENLGTSPTAVVRTSRLQLAKQLIAKSKLTMTQIAFASGFQSIRQFNDSFKRLFDAPPSHFRRARKSQPNVKRNAHFEIQLAYRPPFDWQALLAFLRPRQFLGIESIDRSIYRRFVAFDDAYGTVEVSNCANRHHLSMLVPIELWKHAQILANRARTMFDLDADPTLIATQLATAPRLRKRITHDTDFRLPGGWNPFADAIRVILGQQVSVAAASTLCGRLITTWGNSYADAKLSWEFPGPDLLARVDTTQIGIPKTRARAIQHLAAAILTRRIVLDGSMTLEDFVRQATSLPGIGQWTANCIAMRALKEPDAFPTGDLELRRKLPQRGAGSAGDLARLTTKWRPWRAYATMLLWQT